MAEKAQLRGRLAYNMMSRFPVRVGQGTSDSRDETGDVYAVCRLPSHVRELLPPKARAPATSTWLWLLVGYPARCSLFEASVVVEEI